MLPMTVRARDVTLGNFSQDALLAPTLLRRVSYGDDLLSLITMMEIETGGMVFSAHASHLERTNPLDDLCAAFLVPLSKGAWVILISPLLIPDVVRPTLLNILVRHQQSIWYGRWDSNPRTHGLNVRDMPALLRPCLVAVDANRPQHPAN